MDLLRARKVIDVHPELGDINNPNRFIEFLHPDLQIFIKKCYEHADYEIDEYVNLVCEILLDYLIRKGHYVPDVSRGIVVDTLLMAALLHNIYYDTSVTSLFKAREEFTPIGRDKDLYSNGPVPDTVLDAVFQAIEEQEGDIGEIAKLKPLAGSPSDLLAISIWMAEFMSLKMFGVQLEQELKNELEQQFNKELK
jgi:hypothetical protein